MTLYPKNYIYIKLGRIQKNVHNENNPAMNGSLYQHIKISFTPNISPKLPSKQCFLDNYLYCAAQNVHSN